MHSPDHRAARLSAFDAFAGELTRARIADVECGGLIAGEEIDALDALARRVWRDVNDWGAAMATIETSGIAPFDPSRAAALVLETVFDEALAPDPWRVLSAALDLARAA